MTQSDLVRFVNRVEGGKRVLNSKIGYRYLRLLERCYEYLNVIPNPAKQAILATDRAEMPKDDAGRALSPDQLQRFFAALPVDPPRRRRVTAFDGWKRHRDRAMQVVIALAGLRVAEAIGLLVHEVGNQAKLDGSVDLTITPEEKHDTSYEHIAPLSRGGMAELRPWLDERERMVKQLALPGDFVFPANVEGGKMTKKPFTSKSVQRSSAQTWTRREPEAGPCATRSRRNNWIAAPILTT